MVRLWSDPIGLSDLELAARIAARDRAAVRIVTERNNQRLFRVAWSVLKQREEAEDVVQSTYMRGFAAIGSFAGRSSLSTWLTRIAINEALGRARAAQRSEEHTSELQSLMRISYAVFCLKKQKNSHNIQYKL